MSCHLHDRFSFHLILSPFGHKQGGQSRGEAAGSEGEISGQSFFQFFSPLEKPSHKVCKEKPSLEALTLLELLIQRKCEKLWTWFFEFVLKHALFLMVALYQPCVMREGVNFLKKDVP